MFRAEKHCCVMTKYSVFIACQSTVSYQNMQCLSHVKAQCCIKIYSVYRMSKHSVVSKYIEDIYFSEVNTKYISSNVMKISVNSRVRSTSEISDIFNT